MSFKLSNARYLVNDGYPILEVEVDGKVAQLGGGAKPQIHAAGLVYLGWEFEDVVPPRKFQPDDGGPLTLEGFSDDPRLFRLYDGFLRASAAGSFQPGPVAIPA